MTDAKKIEKILNKLSAVHHEMVIAMRDKETAAILQKSHQDVCAAMDKMEAVLAKAHGKR